MKHLRESEREREISAEMVVKGIIIERNERVPEKSNLRNL